MRNRRALLGTRGSTLALAQSNWVAEKLRQLGWNVELRIIKTTGDQVTSLPLGAIGVKGLFVSEIEQALLAREVDVAVHSLKDLPTEMPDGLRLASVPEREDPRDVLVSLNADSIATLREGALVGTSSLRRKAQLLAARPDLRLVELRGNVDTRLRRLDEGRFDAICMAAAGLHRLGLADRITEYIEVALMVPAVGQGALAIQTRTDGGELVEDLRTLHHKPTELAVRAERAVLATLGGGCNIPLGVLGISDGDSISLTATLCKPDGTEVIRQSARGTGTPEELGRELAIKLWEEGGNLFPELNPKLN